VRNLSLSFPNVSIGNPELFERSKKEWIPFYKGMTEENPGSPIRSGMTNTEKPKYLLIFS
jgi:hypothetical protein